jgi:hypothetical protein
VLQIHEREKSCRTDICLRGGPTFMKKLLTASIPMLCLLVVAMLPLAVPARADSQWTLNNVVTQSGATISGSFDISYNSNVLLEQLTNWSITYTPAAGSTINGGAAVVFDPANVPAPFGVPIQPGYIPMYTPGNLPFPPPGVTSLIIFNSSDVNTTLSQAASLDINFPFAALPDLGPNNPLSVNQAICTTANSNSGNPGYVTLCDGNTGIGPSAIGFEGLPNQQGFGESVDPGTVSGAYILGTPGPTGGGNTGVPEPSTLLLSSLGFAALALKRFWA